MRQAVVSLEGAHPPGLLLLCTVFAKAPRALHHIDIYPVFCRLQGQKHHKGVMVEHPRLTQR